MSSLRALLVLASLTLLVLTGCDSKMAKVNGKIVFEGKPVTGGSLLFAPKVPDGQFEGGRHASAKPDENGEFQLSTHAKNDGVLIGEHVVSYLAPGPPRGKDEAAWDRHRKFGDLRLPPGYTVEVKPGTNDITLKLERAP